MSNRLEEELKVMMARRNAIKNDLNNLAVEMSATSQVVLIVEVARLDNDIRELKEEMETMAFEDFMREAWNGENDLP